MTAVLGCQLRPGCSFNLPGPDFRRSLEPLRRGIGLVMETDTARAIVKAIYPTIIVITVMMLLAASLV
jgi:hypothetical protein